MFLGTPFCKKGFPGPLPKNSQNMLPLSRHSVTRRSKTEVIAVLERKHGLALGCHCWLDQQWDFMP